MFSHGRGPLLRHIPRVQLSEQQEDLRPAGILEDLSMYELLREPTDLHEFDWLKRDKIAIWRENGSAIVIRRTDFKRLKEGLCVVFVLFGDYNLYCAIYGETNSAIAETLTFFLSLKHPAVRGTELVVRSRTLAREHQFDFAALRAQQLAQILDANPTRKVFLQNGTFNAEHSVILATRPDRFDLRIEGGAAIFLDGGAAFVNALEDRDFTFGALEISCKRDGMPFTRVHLKRLFEVNTLKKLVVCATDDEESGLLPLSAKVHTLEYRVRASHIRPEHFDSLQMVAKDLTLKITSGTRDAWDALLISFLNRAAVLGHFETLRLSIQFQNKTSVFDSDVVAPVAVALAGAIAGNPNLVCLDLSDTQLPLHWGTSLQNVLTAMETHYSLRSFVVQRFPLEGDWNKDDFENDEDDLFRARFGFRRSRLRRLLGRNRHIKVVDTSGKKCTDGSTIDTAYALNDFHNGSGSLTKGETVLRPLLVATALTESASANFQYTALLLSQHADTLCEMLLGAGFGDSTPLPAPISRRKRKKTSTSEPEARVPRPRAAKKVPAPRK